MKFLYISSPSRPAVPLTVSCTTVGELVAMMRWTHDEVEMVRLARVPYVLLRRYVPRDSRTRRGALLRVVDRWDMATGGECLVARLDGEDVEEDFDVWQWAVHPFSLYEACDPRGAHGSMDGHVSYFSWDGGREGPVIYAWPTTTTRCHQRGSAERRSARVAAARAKRPLRITPSVPGSPP